MKQNPVLAEIWMQSQYWK